MDKIILFKPYSKVFHLRGALIRAIIVIMPRTLFLILPILFDMKTPSAYYVCCIYSNSLQKTLNVVVNTMNPDLGSYCLQYRLSNYLSR